MHDDSDEESDEEPAVGRKGSSALQQRLQGATLQNAGAVLDVNIHRLDITITFEEEGTSSSSRGPRTTKSACIPACLEESFCRQTAADLATDVGRDLDVMEQELLALELREVATLRGWAGTFVPLLRGGHQGFLLDNSTKLSEDVDLGDFRRRLDESLAKARASPWSFGGKILKSVNLAAQQRAELEERAAEFEEAVADAAVRRQPQVFRGSAPLLEVQYVESRAPWWVDAADGLLQMLEDRGVERGQVISIDAHTNDPDREAAFSAHYSLRLPGSGSLNIRYRRTEVDGKEAQSANGASPDAGPEFAWQGLYEWANSEARNRQVISMTASCARHGGGVLTCFYYKEPLELDDIQVLEEQSTYWILASRELARALPAAGVRAGQVLWIDAHSLPGSNSVVFSAHFSRSLPDRGELFLRCEANECRRAFKEAAELHNWAASRVTQLKLAREDLVSITYASDLHGRSTCFIFYLDSAASPTGSAGGPPSIPLLPSVPSLRPLPQLPKEPPIVVTARKVINADHTHTPRLQRNRSKDTPPSIGRFSQARNSMMGMLKGPEKDAATAPGPVPEARRTLTEANPPKRVQTQEPEDFEVLQNKVVFLGSYDQESMPADDLEACKKFCRKQRFGAFVVTNKTAYFRHETAEACAEHLVDDPRSTTYLRHAPASAWGGVSKLHLLTHSLSRAGKSVTSMTSNQTPRVQITEGKADIRHDACTTCALQ